MQNKQNTKAKVIVVAIAILLCLALAVGITGAFYQAQRRATGTVKMDKGIVIDYTGFGKEADGIWIRENETTFRLFSDTDVQPGEKISLLGAGIKANASSVDFYARVKLSYEFYNGETKLETLPASFKASDLITTSSTFFGADWVKSSDGYHYYGVDTTLSKFTKAAPATFVDLFDTNAKFIIEGANFTGVENGGEGGGFVVGDTSINKIVIYLTLETLQGDATAEQAQALGWEIIASAGDVVFAEATEKLETSVDKVETTENLNVSVGGAPEVPLNEVVFPYDTPTILEFDSKNVEYVELTYSNGEKETFYELAASEESATKYSQVAVTANSSKGTVTGYTVGVFSDSEYKGFTYSYDRVYENPENYDMTISAPMPDGTVALAGYLGTDTAITIPSSVRVRERDFKLVLDGYTNKEEFMSLIGGMIMSIKYPCTLNDTQTLNSIEELGAIVDSINEMTDEGFMTIYPKMEFKYKTLCVANNLLSQPKTVKEINAAIFMSLSIESVNVPASIETINGYAFSSCSSLTTVVLNEGLKYIGREVFSDCSSLQTINIPNSVTSIGQWVFSSCSSLATIKIDSLTIAALESSDSNLLLNAQTVYVKTGLTVGSYITGSFTKQGSSDKAGYDMYTKN